MLMEISFGGMLFSPLALYIPLALLFTVLFRWALHRVNMRFQLWHTAYWNEAWLDISLFIIFLALTIAVTGRY
ncbi:MAG: DUF1656 domain-containing protein [Oceanospirillaceae bacterium]|uniref:DUF1656 domain-containing protein n=1 Tax=unclassified Thalassolituus TaxID=2624967 RepID=UPI000C096B64|nr:MULTISPECIES: DUF1656 domain-containing protein [unclassified Thalassolituus]MAK89827.1 DUF1656 domain-containing protein [Thalassolituus sp.]MAS26567.1 DUF1656 domain-containing protein [Oceanospirillaceae bacterium]MAY00699.1 DUF1656 domain-containing protein [Oceanospirillaceae bacterium]MBL34226.1 DUF1656 domain-containing protein [Oceanospirillaceae bacterium]MBS53810.1 DUF1656 domain-containing protein [Oceanospirillaceae bacterium]|tara:strand:+ start:130 stop:348 length:219 start_codon:yes stop_codon:yes gene_type:complete